MMRYKALKTIQVILAIYVGILTYADMGPPGGLRDPETGLIIDQESEGRTEDGLMLVNGSERAIIATTQFQVVCIGITRMSAFFMYPALVLVFASKFRATISFLNKSPLSMYMYNDSHELHVYCGWTILLFSTIHVIFHIARWAQQGNLYLLFHHFSGLSGVVIISSCLLISLPMTIFRKRIRFEIRKYLHYLFIVFAGALVFHTPTSAIPNGGFTAWVFGIILVWYFLDGTYCFFFMTEKIDTTKFSVLDCGVRMTMTVSDRFQKMGNQGGVCYVCLPWINKNQWHAFSLFEDPENPAERQIFIQKRGDWTNQVHRVLQRDTVRPAWINGPFPSPFDNADAYDNQILVASGIGITPALSVIRAHKDTRRINLVWVVRDAALLEFFLKHLYLDHDGWNLIFYTGKKKLRDQCIHLESDTNICIISGRPNLKELIPNMIYGIESGVGLPEKYTPEFKVAASEALANEFLASSRLRLASVDETEKSGAPVDVDIMEDLALQASELGFKLSTERISQELVRTVDSHLEKRRCSFKLDDTPESPLTNQRALASSTFLLGSTTTSSDDEKSMDSVNDLIDDLALQTAELSFKLSSEGMMSQEIGREESVDLEIEKPILSNIAHSGTLANQVLDSMKLLGSISDDDGDQSVEASIDDDGSDEPIDNDVCQTPSSTLVFKLPTNRISSPSSSQKHSVSASLSDTEKLSAPESIRVSAASIRENLSIAFRPWDYHEGAHDYVKKLDKKLVLPTWGILYCGGTKKVLNILEEISNEHGIGLHVESFAW